MVECSWTIGAGHRTSALVASAQGTSTQRRRRPEIPASPPSPPHDGVLVYLCSSPHPELCRFPRFVQGPVSTSRSTIREIMLQVQSQQSQLDSTEATDVYEWPAEQPLTLCGFPSHHHCHNLPTIKPLLTARWAATKRSWQRPASAMHPSGTCNPACGLESPLRRVSTAPVRTTCRNGKPLHPP
ncbi:hypothetical protein LIA77_08635 [Sarocladium implicatum]|nr:hypothetical protein LIA77_08635 [Sarocladium implicatum]